MSSSSQFDDLNVLCPAQALLEVASDKSDRRCSLDQGFYDYSFTSVPAGQAPPGFPKAPTANHSSDATCSTLYGSACSDLSGEQEARVGGGDQGVGISDPAPASPPSWDAQVAHGASRLVAMLEADRKRTAALPGPARAAPDGPVAPGHARGDERAQPLRQSSACCARAAPAAVAGGECGGGNEALVGSAQGTGGCGRAQAEKCALGCCPTRASDAGRGAVVGDPPQGPVQGGGPHGLPTASMARPPDPEIGDAVGATGESPRTGRKRWAVFRREALQPSPPRPGPCCARPAPVVAAQASEQNRRASDAARAHSKPRGKAVSWAGLDGSGAGGTDEPSPDAVRGADKARGKAVTWDGLDAAGADADERKAGQDGWVPDAVRRLGRVRGELPATDAAAKTGAGCGSANPGPTPGSARVVRFADEEAEPRCRPEKPGCGAEGVSKASASCCPQLSEASASCCPQPSHSAKAPTGACGAAGASAKACAKVCGQACDAAGQQRSGGSAGAPGGCNGGGSANRACRVGVPALGVAGRHAPSPVTSPSCTPALELSRAGGSLKQTPGDHCTPNPSCAPASPVPGLTRGGSLVQRFDARTALLMRSIADGADVVIAQQALQAHMRWQQFRRESPPSVSMPQAFSAPAWAPDTPPQDGRRHPLPGSTGGHNAPALVQDSPPNGADPGTRPGSPAERAQPGRALCDSAAAGHAAANSRSELPCCAGRLQSQQPQALGGSWGCVSAGAPRTESTGWAEMQDCMSAQWGEALEGKSCCVGAAAPCKDNGGWDRQQCCVSGGSLDGALQGEPLEARGRCVSITSVASSDVAVPASPFDGVDFAGCPAVRNF